MGKRIWCLWRARYRIRCAPVPLLLLYAGLTACAAQNEAIALAYPVQFEQSAAEDSAIASDQATPLPTRPPFNPGELVEYIVQTGDTLPALASHFNTTVEEIREANPIIPTDATTLPPGMPMQIPIYFAPLWGSPFKIIPDSHFVNGPLQVGFDAHAFIAEHPGWLNGFSEYASGANRSTAEIIDLVAQNFSVSPRLLLALLEYQGGALSQASPPEGLAPLYLGKSGYQHRGLYLQLVWAANTLNNGYYLWRTGDLTSIVHKDGTRERPDPWQNAASVAIQVYFNELLPPDEYQKAIGPEGLARTYQELFGDPWAADEPHLPGSLTQPPFALPFETGKTWALTGGPHTGWGEGAPLAALDFAPPSVVGGCTPTKEWATAVAPGLVVRSEPAIAVLDLDGDGDERTGWVVFYLHLGDEGRAPVGRYLETGDPIGHPSCEGGRSTGTHVHLARKYNGEWIPAAGPLAFNLEGWIAQNGAAPYLGTLTRFGRTVTACVCSDAKTFITAGENQLAVTPEP
jgi:LysM repeat protein